MKGQNPVQWNRTIMIIPLQRITQTASMISNIISVLHYSMRIQFLLWQYEKLQILRTSSFQIKSSFEQVIFDAVWRSKMAERFYGVFTF